ncbi:MAG: hypothetical protein WCE79_24275 [Xanthobacteraceae bacterium]
MRWVTLRSLGNSRAAQLSVLFPAIGYLILFNDQIARFLSMEALDGHLNQVSVVTALWRNKLYFVYFGLMAMGIGSAIYQVACPYIVKKHGDWADYVRVDGDSISDAGAKQLATALEATYQSFWPLEERENATVDLMRNWYGYQSSTQPIARYSVTILFLLGLGLLAVPSVLTAVKVLGVVLTRF